MPESNDRTITLNVNLKPSESAVHPRAVNYSNVGVTQGIAHLDFGFIDPALLAAVAKTAKDGRAAPKGLDGHFVSRVAMSLDAFVCLQQQIRQVLVGFREAGRGREMSEVLENRRKDSGMKKAGKVIVSALAVVGYLFGGLNSWTEAGLFGFGGDSWQEEVLLHDGRKVMVERSVERGGRHEIGQKPPYKEQRLRFTMPGATQTVTWEDHYSDDLGQANFLPMALDIVSGTPYLVVHPMGCLSYNKWGRPNPPYVVFHYKDKEWTRIPMEQLPATITTPNMIFSEPDAQIERLGTRVVTADMIKGVIGGYQQPEYRMLLRGPVKQDWPSKTSCPIPSTATGKLILPEIDGKPLYDNWWPLASEWLKSTYGKDR